MSKPQARRGTSLPFRSTPSTDELELSKRRTQQDWDGIGRCGRSSSHCGNPSLYRSRQWAVARPPRSPVRLADLRMLRFTGRTAPPSGSPAPEVGGGGVMDRRAFVFSMPAFAFASETVYA